MQNSSLKFIVKISVRGQELFLTKSNATTDMIKHAAKFPTEKSATWFANAHKGFNPQVVQL